MSWQEINAYINNKKENPIRKFMKEIGFTDNIAYEYQDHYCSLIIHTKHPGIWIGKAGSGKKRLEEILKEEWERDVAVNFVEVKGNFLFRDKDMED